jgi:thiamine-monophosphate kinase
MPIGEFELIERYFSRPAARRDVELGVGDDAALLAPPAGRMLVAAVDTLVEGRHFPAEAPAHSVGHQALAVNLSDLAAMGAEPAWALLAMSLPAVDEAWLAAFADGLYGLAARHGVALVGGDTVRGPRVITITALGFVESGRALRRDGARTGDVLYVSGWPGEAAAGLAALRSGASLADDPLVCRYRYAEPRVALGRALVDRASAAMDVSDGLLGDLRKLCAASGVGARLDLERLPVSDELVRRHATESCERFVLHGGDDYELLFTLPADAAAGLEAELSKTCVVHRIGAIEVGDSVRCLRDGRVVAAGGSGYDHFN